MMESRSPYYIGLDLGGTSIKAGLVDQTGRPLAKSIQDTPSQQGPEVVVQAMAEMAHRVAQDAGLTISQVKGIGIGAPGPIDVENGIIRGMVNLPGWRDVPICKLVTRATGCPVVLENDANAATYGEFWAGAGRDPAVRHMVMMTLGTGIGSGVVIDSHIVHGGHGYAGELGHIIVSPDGRSCPCGQKGCLEAYSSASSTARRVADAVGMGQPSVLASKVQGGKPMFSAKEVFEAAGQGDALAMRVIEESANYLGIACVNICRMLDPHMIVLGGGMVAAGDYLIHRVRSAFQAHEWSVVAPQVRIVASLLGNDAGFIGAAAMAWDRDRTGRLG